MTTAPFTVDGPWVLTWVYDCSLFGRPGSFTLVRTGPLTVSRGHQSGFGGTGIQRYIETGAHRLQIVSDCAWQVTITRT